MFICIQYSEKKCQFFFTCYILSLIISTDLQNPQKTQAIHIKSINYKTFSLHARLFIGCQSLAEVPTILPMIDCVFNKKSGALCTQRIPLRQQKRQGPALRSACLGKTTQQLKICYFTVSASLLPALKRATFRALMVMGFPVWGLRPWRAALLVTENVPKPTRVTLSPFFKAAVTASSIPPRVFSAAALLMPPAFAIFSTNSLLFIPFLPPREF